ncbi:MAG: F0F1 ATP synthase subunit A [Myxococcales bacterium]|nr:F0F1 ATP synthase subunit A [Myxococcales bacterium]
MNPTFVLRVFGLEIADTVIVTIALTLTLVLACALISRRLTTRGLSLTQTAVEVLVRAVDDAVREIVGEDPAPYTPLVGGLMIFIGACNLLGAVPFVRPPTADLSTSVALALVVLGATPYYGIRRRGLKGYLATYLRPHPLMLPFNLIGELSRTIALAVRLFGNVMSGTMIGAVLLVVAGFLVPLPLMFLGLITAVVQAYIFGILAAVYIAAAVQVDRERPSPPKETPSWSSRQLSASQSSPQG